MIIFHYKTIVYSSPIRQLVISENLSISKNQAVHVRPETSGGSFRSSGSDLLVFFSTVVVQLVVVWPKTVPDPNVINLTKLYYYYRYYCHAPDHIENADWWMCAFRFRLYSALGHQGATRPIAAPRMTLHLRLLLQNCTTFIHLRLFSFYFTFGLTPPSPLPYLPLLLWVPVLEETSSDHHRLQAGTIGLIRHWLNWFLLHFTGHHATQKKKEADLLGWCKIISHHWRLNYISSHSAAVAFIISARLHFYIKDSVLQFQTVQHRDSCI